MSNIIELTPEFRESEKQRALDKMFDRMAALEEATELIENKNQRLFLGVAIGLVVASIAMVAYDKAR